MINRRGKTAELVLIFDELREIKQIRFPSHEFITTNCLSQRMSIRYPRHTLLFGERSWLSFVELNVLS